MSLPWVARAARQGEPRKWTGKTLDEHKADRANIVRLVLEEAGIEVDDKDRCAADVLADDGQPRFQWSTLPLGDASYQDTVFAAVLQRRAWREQYEQAKAATGRDGPPVENRSATHQPATGPAA